MATSTPPPKPSKTRIVFDLADVLTDEEIQRFEAAAKASGSENLTEHFLNLTLRLPSGEKKESAR